MRPFSQELCLLSTLPIAAPSVSRSFEDKYAPAPMYAEGPRPFTACGVVVGQYGSIICLLHNAHVCCIEELVQGFDLAVVVFARLSWSTADCTRATDQQ